MPSPGVPSLEASPFDSAEFVALWTLAALTFGAGDVLTTLFVIETSPEIVEANLLILHTVERYGGAGLAGLKLLGFALCLAISLYAAAVRDSWLYYFPPTVLTVAGTLFTVNNAVLLLG